MKGYELKGIMQMWNIKQTEEFQEWFNKSSLKLKRETLKHVDILSQFGPHLGRPFVDTLKGSSILNLKELRFNCGEKVIRITFVFDPDRNGVLIIGGNKSGSGDKRFYDKIMLKSEKIYFDYLEKLKAEKTIKR